MSDRAPYRAVGLATRKEPGDNRDELTAPEIHLLLLDDPMLARLLSRVQSEPGQHLTLEEAAATCFLHPTTFSSRFRKRTGMTFSIWYRYLRVERAKRLLLRSGTTVLRVALAVGYRDVGTFTRAFKKSVGLTPQAYLRTVREEARWR